jgi:hypothetical protein
MGRINDDALADLRTKNPRGVHVYDVVPEDAPADAVGDEYVFRKIDRAAFVKNKALQKRSFLGQGGGDEATMLARELLIWPSVEEFDAMREAMPAICEEIGQRLLEDASAHMEVREGKR